MFPFKTTQILLLTAFCIINFTLFAQETQVKDDFEGNGTITTWYGDDCSVDTDFSNPNQTGINTSDKVLKYTDEGGSYANIGFNIPFHFDLGKAPKFTFQIYVESSSLTGTQNNQVSFKLQNGAIFEPWTSQTEIIKNLELDKWQEITVDFENDNFINYDANAADPVNRDDLNRAVIQINGENNNDKVVAYIDNFEYESTIGWDSDPNHQGYTYLIWNDEFEGEGAIDDEKWHHQTLLPNGEGWFNGELQHYTNREENSYLENGFMNLVAKRENFTDQGKTKDFTSARLNSKFAFTYGRVEVRAKLPSGAGTWPALWFLGKNINEDGAYFDEEFGTTNWPACGEIDLMEHWGTNQNFVQAAMHTPSSSGNTVNKGGIYANDVSNLFHVYGMVWTPEKIDFTVDGKVIYTYAPNDKNMDTWPYDAPQYMIINTAINADIAADFKESPFVIDYIRIYSDEEPTSIKSETIESTVSIYPNPSSDLLNVLIENNHDFSIIQVFDNLGKEVIGKNIEMNQSQMALDISGLAIGNYTIRLSNETKATVIDFVKSE
ncbi:MAG: family 16 glycosylhydrolase [Bacteroidia bacterium]